MAKRKNLNLAIPEIFQGHHRTEIVSYRGKNVAHDRQVHDDTQLMLRSCEEVYWCAHLPNRPISLSGSDSDYVLLLPQVYPPHTPVMDAVVGNPDVNEAEWREFCLKYRDGEFQKTFESEDAPSEKEDVLSGWKPMTEGMINNYLEQMIHLAPDKVGAL